MAWGLNFISEEDFKKHVRATIMKYGEKLESYDLERLRIFLNWMIFRMRWIVA